LKHIVTIDTRDNSVLPTGGYFLRVCQELAGGALGGDVNFIKHEAEYQSNWSIYNDLTFQLSANAGHMSNASEGNFNICDKFFLGGPMSLRGFQFRGVGPHTEGAGLGGTSYWASGAHLYAPLPFRQGRGYLGEYLRLHAFLTAGALCEGFDSAKLQDPRTSAGLGLVLSMGHVARIELNYCVPLKYESQDRTNHGLQIRLGVSFL